MAPDHDPAVLACARAAAEQLAAPGHRLQPLAGGIDTDAILPHFRIISGSDRLAVLGTSILADPERATLIGPYVRQAWDTAAGFSAIDYARAMAHRDSCIADLATRFDALDVILSPTAGTTALPIPSEGADPLWRPPGYFAYTFVANYTGFPALILPCGVVEGLPVGLHMMGPPGSEPLLLQFGRKAEALFGRFSPNPEE
jgi:Asp-tRNA(Asn)/Glu-tRNA(Gln) amidotransferase A subunit family amidase